jgi:tRNA U34 5-methylaminomethyl-2-thiouridine-forming methyltransferase MnmC
MTARSCEFESRFPHQRAFGIPGAFFLSAVTPDMRLIVTQDGSHSLLSEEFGVSYHSRFGAITESTHVFIDAGLRYKAALQRQLRLLEVGFGTGLNAFLTLLEAERRNLTIHYTALETRPIPIAEAKALNYVESIGAITHKKNFLELHLTDWDKPLPVSEYFEFEKQLRPVEQLAPEPRFDLIYYDAFAPNAQPELWSETLMARMYEALLPEGVLVTYCAQGAFKRNLKNAGFVVEALQGPPGKREMTRALKL